MSKIINALVVSSALFLAGCANSSGPKVPSSSGNVETNDTRVQISQPANRDALYQRLQGLDLAGCRNLGDSYYANGDFLNAVIAYDFTCVKFQDIPTCVKMARMFERGEGVSVNKAAALDIYKRACYGGHDASCKDMKRLER
ncbi:MAG: SEL1-like repeat protein [Campylobacteraceae bacterium]|nr:SEL1-like repeat protein [Campylobacteraceae bacterium]